VNTAGNKPTSVDFADFDGDGRLGAFVVALPGGGGPGGGTCSRCGFGMRGGERTPCLKKREFACTCFAWRAHARPWGFWWGKHVCMLLPRLLCCKHACVPVWGRSGCPRMHVGDACVRVSVRACVRVSVRACAYIRVCMQYIAGVRLRVCASGRAGACVLPKLAGLRPRVSTPSHVPAAWYEGADIVAANSGGQRVNVYIQSSTATSWAARGIVAGTVVNNGVSWVSVGDLNGDGTQVRMRMCLFPPGGAAQCAACVRATLCVYSHTCACLKATVARTRVTGCHTRPPCQGCPKLHPTVCAVNAGYCLSVRARARVCPARVRLPACRGAMCVCDGLSRTSPLCQVCLKSFLKPFLR
jgi:hypothetical protein